MTTQNDPYLSIVIPVKDEAQSLPHLFEELTSVLKSLEKNYEIIVINDGSTDDSKDVLVKLQKKYPPLTLINFHANFGKSAALAAGFIHSRGDVIVTMDSDLQDDPRDITKLLNTLNSGCDLVCGWRQHRADSSDKRWASWFFNNGTSWLTGVHLHDMNCGLKAMKKTVAHDINLHGELHRFIPVLAAKRKFQVTEIPVNNRKRRFGQSKYGFERSWRGIVDLMTAIFLTDYAGKPGHFFGKIGLLFFAAGFVMDAYVAYIRITTGSTQERIPLLLAGILLMVLGVQLFSTGLIAEMILHNSPNKQSQYVMD